MCKIRSVLHHGRHRLEIPTNLHALLKVRNLRTGHIPRPDGTPVGPALMRTVNQKQTVETNKMKTTFESLIETKIPKTKKAFTNFVNASMPKAKAKPEMQATVESILKQNGINRKIATVTKTKWGWRTQINVHDFKRKEEIRKLLEHLDTFEVDNTDLRTGQSVKVELSPKANQAAIDSISEEKVNFFIKQLEKKDYNFLIKNCIFEPVEEQRRETIRVSKMRDFSKETICFIFPDNFSDNITGYPIEEQVKRKLAQVLYY